MDELLAQMITQAPNFVGFIVGLLALLQVIRKLQDTNDKLITAIIRRENCDGPPFPPRAP